MKRNSAFTLVEILIVVIILGILAAIVIPQFTQASSDARTSALASDLQTVRSQLELYKIQHLDVYPAAASFITLLTNRTNQAGTTGTDPNSFPYGRYLMKFPTNPFVTNSNANAVETGTGSGGGGDYGWYFNTSTGKFTPDDDAHTSL